MNFASRISEKEKRRLLTSQDDRFKLMDLSEWLCASYIAGWQSDNTVLHDAEVILKVGCNVFFHV